MDNQEVAEILTKTTREPTNVATQPVMADFGAATLETIKAYMDKMVPRRFVAFDSETTGLDNVIIVSAEDNAKQFYRRLEQSIAPIMVTSVKPPDYPIIDHILPRGHRQAMVMIDDHVFSGKTANANGRVYSQGVWDRALKDATFPVELMPERSILPKTAPPWLYDREHVHALEEGTAQEFSDNVVEVMEDTAYQRAKRIADVLETYNIRVKFNKITCDYLKGELTIAAETERNTHQLNTLMRNKKVRESMWGKVTVVITPSDSKEHGTTHYHYQGSHFVQGLSDYNLASDNMHWVKKRSGYALHGTHTGRWRSNVNTVQPV